MKTLSIYEIRKQIASNEYSSELMLQHLMINYIELEAKFKAETHFPVLNGILSDHIEKGARIVKQDGQWHLFRADCEGLAYGPTISAMLCNLIFTDGCEEKTK